MAKAERRSWAELEECIDELYRRMDRVDPPDDYPSMAEQYRRAERWKRIEAAAKEAVSAWDAGSLLEPKFGLASRSPKMARLREALEP